MFDGSEGDVVGFAVVVLAVLYHAASDGCFDEALYVLGAEFCFYSLEVSFVSGFHLDFGVDVGFYLSYEVGEYLADEDYSYSPFSEFSACSFYLYESFSAAAEFG